MDRPSENTGDPEQEDRDVASLASRPSESKASHGSWSPAETAEPEPQLEAGEASKVDAAATEPAEPRQGPAATEAAGEEGPGEREWSAEAEPEEVAEAGAEEPAKLEMEGGPEEEAEGEEALSPSSPPLTTTDQEKAAPVPEAERAGRQGDEDGRAESELEPRGSGEEGLEWTAEEQQEPEQRLRAELLEQYRSLLAERRCCQRYNARLQHSISEALRRKRGLDAEGADRAAGPDDPEKERAYASCLALLEELRKQRTDDLVWFRQELGQLEQQSREKLARVEAAWLDFQALKKQVVMQALGSCRLRGGREAARREVEQIQALEAKKEREISAVRLENVQLRQGLAHFETRTRAQEDLAEGLLLIDFEQLKIENQTFNEKVEERNEELLKLRNKVNSNVQIITHMKEKLHFVELGNADRKSELLEMEAQVARRRDILTKTKQARDSLRTDNVKLSQKSGLLGKEALLRDLEEKVGRAEGLQQRLQSLQRHHAGLTLSCRGVKQKIQEARAFLPC